MFETDRLAVLVLQLVALATLIARPVLTVMHGLKRKIARVQRGVRTALRHAQRPPNPALQPVLSPVFVAAGVARFPAKACARTYRAERSRRIRAGGTGLPPAHSMRLPRAGCQ